MSNTGRMNNLRAMPGLLAAKGHWRSVIRGQLTESEDGGKGQSADSGWVALAIKFVDGRANLFRRFARRRADRRTANPIPISLIPDRTDVAKLGCCVCVAPSGQMVDRPTAIAVNRGMFGRCAGAWSVDHGSQMVDRVGRVPASNELRGCAPACNVIHFEAGL